MSNQVFSNQYHQYGLGDKRTITFNSVAGYGWTDAHQITAKIYRNDELCVVEFPEITKTGLASNTFEILTQAFLPVEYRPTTKMFLMGLRIKKAGTWVAGSGMAVINIDGTVAIHPDGGEAPYSWGADGIRGFDQFCVSYII